MPILCRTLLRASLFTALFIAPMAAAAIADGGAQSGKGGVGFVLYVALQRP